MSYSKPFSAPAGGDYHAKPLPVVASPWATDAVAYTESPEGVYSGTLADATSYVLYRGSAAVLASATADQRADMLVGIVVPPAPTAAEIRGELDANSTQLGAIKADTGNVQADLADGGRIDGLIDTINANAASSASASAGNNAILANLNDIDAAEVRQEMDANSTELAAAKTAAEAVQGKLPADSRRMAGEGDTATNLDEVSGGGGGSDSAVIATGTIGTVTNSRNFLLAGTLSSDDNAYRGMVLLVTKSGETNRISRRTIVSYNGGTGAAVIDSALDFTPTLGDTFKILEVGNRASADSQVSVPRSRRAVLQATSDGLVSDPIAIEVSDSALPIAVSFAKDLPANVRIAEITSVSVIAGTPGGLLAAEIGRNGSEAIIALTGVTEGDLYKLKVTALFDDGGTRAGVTPVYVHTAS